MSRFLARASASPTYPPPAPGARGLLLPLLAAAILASVGAGRAVRAQEPTPAWDPAAASAEIRELRSRATDPDQALEAVLALTAVLDRLDARRDAAGELPEIESELFLRALEYRSRAQLGRGQRAEAADDLRIVILADPGWRLDRTDLSPAVVDLFEEQRSELVAYLTVRTEPPEVTVLVGEEPVGQTPLIARPILAGAVRIGLERAGYAPVEEPRREIFAGEVVVIERELERRGPVLAVITAPAGVTVRVEGRVVGSTGGTLPEELRPLVPPRFSGEEFSAPLELDGLMLGANEITLEAPCRRPSRFTFHADEARDYLPRFVRLRPSTGGLRIESVPSGGRVFLNGEERGVAPLSFSAMCAGDHRVDIHHPAGRCGRSFTVSRGARTAIRCEIRPVLSLIPSAPESAPAVDRVVRRALGRAETFDVIEPPNGEASQAELRIVVPPAGAGPSRLELLASGARSPDAVRFDRFDPETAAAAVEELFAVPVRRRPWLGFTVALHRAQGGSARGLSLEVAAVHPAGPAALAGIEPGDEVVEVGGMAVSEELGLDDIASGFTPDATVDILVRREGADRPLRLVPGETPILPSLGARGCNRRLIALEAEFARGQDDPDRRLEAGICWVRLGDPERALLDHLTDARPGEGVGVGRGTALYYRGLALAALSEPVRAREAFEAAAAVRGATLVSHDGPLLAPLARWRAGTIR